MEIWSPSSMSIIMFSQCFLSTEVLAFSLLTGLGNIFVWVGSVEKFGLGADVVEGVLVECWSQTSRLITLQNSRFA